MLIDFVGWLQVRICICYRYAQWFKLFEIRIALDDTMRGTFYFDFELFKFHYHWGKGL